MKTYSESQDLRDIFMEAKIQVSAWLIMSLCVVFIAARIPYWQELIEKLALSEILSPPPSNKCVTDAKVDEVRLMVVVARPLWMAPNFLTKTKIFIISKTSDLSFSAEIPIVFSLFFCFLYFWKLSLFCLLERIKTKSSWFQITFDQWFWFLNKFYRNSNQYALSYVREFDS